MPIKYDNPYISKSIASVISQLGFFEEFLIVSDGASLELKIKIRNLLDKVPVNKKYKIIENESKNIGAGSSRDYGIRIAKAAYIAFIDSDDIWPNNYLKDRTRHIKETNALFSASPYIYVNQGLEVINKRMLKVNSIKKRDLLFENPISNSTVIISRKLIINSGGYSKLKKRNDYATWMKILQTTECLYCNSTHPVLILRRKDSLTSNKLILIGYQFKAFKEGGYTFSQSLILAIVSSVKTLMFHTYGILKRLLVRYKN
ncbi:glycosyltransferase [Prochlorococcus sp. MIT 1307]|uniref:glycosyltransferase n=1 Tax=Prochlorococcus sp. MIT 1307 TaxID=3096219 RepID=UPI002A760502|nr:glycosyltransferase [Prochlorococcus sp. MIT 1307]